MKTLIITVALIAMISIPVFSQKISGSSATSVSAEMTKGKLNPAESKAGDQVMLKLKDDVKSNGEVILKKGATITGVVRGVKHVEGKGQADGRAQSMMEIEWFAPAQVGASHQLMLAVQSVTQVSPIYRAQQESDSDWRSATNASVSSAGAVQSTGSGLLGGTLGTVGNVGANVGAAASGALQTTGNVASQSNVALMNMPSVVAADARTASAVESNLGPSGGHQLFQTGHGEIITSGGSKQSLDIFSHMNNDTVLTSPGKNFEITSGAQMQLLVGVHKN